MQYSWRAKIEGTLTPIERANKNTEQQFMIITFTNDENHIFAIESILRHKQVACMRRKMLFTIFKYLFLFQRYSSF